MPKKLLIIAVIIFITVIFNSTPVISFDNNATVTATVPEFTHPEPDTPVLISPTNNSTISTTAPTFIFNPSWGQVYVDHYQLLIDGGINTNNIPQSTNTIMVNALQALSEGQHTWTITAIGNNGVNRNSATWSFTIDTTAPLILIDRIAGQTTSLSSYDLTTIPPGLTFTTTQSQPIISGQSESGAQISLNLITPTNSIPLAASVGTDKTFSVQPKTPLAPGSYTVFANATDVAGNTTTLPSFTLKITAPARIIIALPSPLPTITLPGLPQPILQFPQALTAFPILLACSPLIWIIIVLLIMYILALHLRIIVLKRRLKTQSNNIKQNQS
ncbi:MAG: Ig-like domain-containing protein [Candidatus Beckwithbacteria bacterium]|nr:Ig-like domain-containing protein [Candidatus Beckwithbacteria bacterium]